MNDGDTIDLDCGRIYAGTLNLDGRRQVTVRTVGDCGPAVITPSRPVDRWQRDTRDPQHPPLWIAELPSAPLMLELDGRYLPLAHYPNARMPWAKGVRTAHQRLRVDLPSTDLVGANLVWRATDWLIQERRIAHVDDHELVLAAGDDEGFGLPPQTAFYVEGKRWMIDTPGEWAWEDGWLFLRMPDRGSPVGRIRALLSGPATQTAAISARDAQDITIAGIVIRAAATGIDGAGSQRLHVRDTRIIHAIDAAIIAGSGSDITRVQIEATVRHGLRANDDARNVRITDSHIRGAGMLGMPKRSKGAIVFEQAQGQLIRGNRISDAAYIGIRVFRHARVSDNLIERACLRLSDCGGIYTFARDRAPLHVVIARNRIHALGGDTSFGIYLDDFANGVEVRDNTLWRNPSGMQLHNGFHNRIERNRFIDSRREHLLFNETAEVPVIDGNHVNGNRFRGPASAPVFRLWSRHGGAHVARFAQFGRNVYAGAPRSLADVEGRGLLDAVQWRQWSGELRQPAVQAGNRADNQTDNRARNLADNQAGINAAPHFDAQAQMGSGPWPAP